MAARRRALPHDLIGFVDLEARELEMIDDPLGEHLPGIVGRVLLEEPAQEIAAPRDRKADREAELGAEGAVIHGRAFLFCSLQRSPRAGLVVKAQSRHPFSAEPDAGRTPPDAALTVLSSSFVRPRPPAFQSTAMTDGSCEYAT